eukprot:m.93314 g.93314  ORF g.93314 m.93314 type:complete len:135 (+) comp16532_c0_seq2:1819-2223(+)
MLHSCHTFSLPNISGLDKKVFLKRLCNDEQVMPAIVVKWLINAYVDTVPEETVLRVWDCLLSEDWKVLYRVGLAMLLRAHRSGELETHDAASVLEFLSNIGWSTFDVSFMSVVGVLLMTWHWCMRVVGLMLMTW